MKYGCPVCGRGICSCQGKWENIGGNDEIRGNDEMKGKQTTREQHLLNFIDPDELNDWEEEFYWSVKEQYKAKGKLSEKQVAVLEKIYEKGGG